MKYLSIVFLAGMLLITTTSILKAHELATHGRITNAAYNKSILADAEFTKQLGIENGKNPFGITYYDVMGGEARERNRQTFEQDNKRMPDGARPLSIEGWLMRGAIREDDYTNETIALFCKITAPNPQDDPYPNPPSRSLNHFYDPHFERPLTVFGADQGQRAPDWALGTNDLGFALSFNSLLENEARRNHFSVFDAIEAQYRAMTGHNTVGIPVAPTQNNRNAYWATTFRALGDMVHLIQDMAQPQHTRNDAHAGICLDIVSGHTSIYEKYTNASALGANSFDIDGTSGKPPALVYNGYPAPVFDHYGDYWKTGDGKGLAEFSNREFYSAGTNVGNSDYPSPASSELFDLNETITLNITDGQPLPSVYPRTFQVKLKARVVDDRQVDQQFAILATTENLWKRRITQKFGPNYRTTLSYTLNRYNYDLMANVLVPRAVGYSAGLINHFFRGRLQIIQARRIGDGLSIRFKNNSADDANDLGITFSQGDFELYYQHTDGTMKKLTLSADAGSSDLPSGNTQVGSALIEHDKEYTLVFKHPLEAEIAKPAAVDAGIKTGTDPPFVLVFKGQVGKEYGIASAAFARDGLLALYQAENWDAGTKHSFKVRVAHNPAKGFRTISDGPSSFAGMRPGAGTYLGNGKLLISGYSESSIGTASTLFRSSDGGRTFSDTYYDQSPPPHSNSLYYEAKIYAGSTLVDGERMDTLATLRLGTLSDDSSSESYLFYQSSNSGMNWNFRSEITGIKWRMDKLTYLGGTEFLTIAVKLHDLNDGKGLRNVWVLLRSVESDTGVSFVVEPINILNDEQLATGIASATGKIVNLGNNTLGLLIKTNTYVDYDTLGARHAYKFYVSTNDGPWVEKGLLPASERILQGTWPTKTFGTADWINSLINLGSTPNGEPQLFTSIRYSAGDAEMIEHYLSVDGGLSWNSVAGPSVKKGTYDFQQSTIITDLEVPMLFYPLDNGTVPGLYD